MSDTQPKDLRNKLAGEVGSGDWGLLAPHAQRDSLILVRSRVGLLDAAIAIAEDDSNRVQTWIQSNDVRKPTPDDLTRFSTGQKTYFQFVIVSPFVLAKEIHLEQPILQ